MQQFLVPTQAERAGDLTALQNCSTNAAGTTTCTPGPVIPQASINPTAAALLTYYPLPNVSGESSYNYEHFQAIPSHTDGADLRIDQAIGSRNSAYARFSRKNIKSSVANPFCRTM